MMRKKPRRFVGNAGPVCTSREDSRYWIGLHRMVQDSICICFTNLKLKKFQTTFPCFTSALIIIAKRALFLSLWHRQANWSQASWMICQRSQSVFRAGFELQSSDSKFWALPTTQEGQHPRRWKGQIGLHTRLAQTISPRRVHGERSSARDTGWHCQGRHVHVPSTAEDDGWLRHGTRYGCARGTIAEGSGSCCFVLC